ncbi:MAG: MFS transporter [Streptococcaceae bacterium]|jgi:MFS family permease|nr:MFS transporter [Streptococcaceae bacterium]
MKINNRNYSWTWLVGTAFFGWILLYSNRSILNPVMDIVQKQYSLNNTKLGLLTSVYFLTYTLAQIPSGLLADRLGSKKILNICFLAFALVNLFTGLNQNIILFIALQGFAGLFAGLYYGPQYSLTYRLLPENKRTLANAIINSGMAFGLSLGYLLSTQLVLIQKLSWHSPYLVLVIPSIIIFIMFKKIIPSDDKLANNNQNIESPTKMTTIFKNKKLMASFILNFASIYAYFVIITWLPKFLITERNVPTSQVGWISSFVPWAALPSMLLIAHISDKYKSINFYLKILIPISAVSILFVANAKSLELISLGLLIYGFFGKLALDPLLIAYVGKNAPDNQLTSALSCLNFFGMSASVLAPLLTGILADLFGTMKIGFWLAAILLILGLIRFIWQSQQS